MFLYLAIALGVLGVAVGLWGVSAESPGLLGLMFALLAGVIAAMYAHTRGGRRSV